jgi:hypothetical protein
MVKLGKLILITAVSMGCPLLGEDAPPLFQSVPANLALSIPVETSPTVKRARVVMVATRLVDAQAAAQFNVAEPTGRGKALTFNLFDDVALAVTLSSVAAASGNSVIWTGKVEGEKTGEVILVVTDNLISAKISTGPGESYAIRYLGADQHVIEELDLTKYPNEAQPPAVPTAALRPDGPIIDVVAVYTAASRKCSSALAAIQNEVQLAVAEANLTYARNGVAQRMRLAYVGCRPGEPGAQHSVQADQSYTQTHFLLRVNGRAVPCSLESANVVPSAPARFATMLRSCATRVLGY